MGLNDWMALYEQSRNKVKLRNNYKIALKHEK